MKSFVCTVCNTVRSNQTRHEYNRAVHKYTGSAKKINTNADVVFQHYNIMVTEKLQI